MNFQPATEKQIKKFDEDFESYLLNHPEYTDEEKIELNQLKKDAISEKNGGKLIQISNLL